MKKINLSQGKSALVDDESFEWLNKMKWHLGTKGYAVHSVAYNKKNIIMHRLIADTPEGMFTDHINGNKLDNRKTNLRICTNTENCRNSGSRKNSTSVYKGVHWNSQFKKWRVLINIGGKVVHLGLFDNEWSAAMVYNLWAKDLFGEFAKLNYPIYHSYLKI